MKRKHNSHLVNLRDTSQECVGLNFIKLILKLSFYIPSWIRHHYILLMHGIFVGRWCILRALQQYSNWPGIGSDVVYINLFFSAPSQYKNTILLSLKLRKEYALGWNKQANVDEPDSLSLIFSTVGKDLVYPPASNFCYLPQYLPCPLAR